MRQVLLAVSLILVYASSSEAFPIADDEIILQRFRYRSLHVSNWEPLIAGWMARRYYKELIGWNSVYRRWRLPTILLKPIVLIAFREDNRGENVDEEHTTDKHKEPQEEPDAVNDSADMESSAEFEHGENNGSSEKRTNKNFVENEVTVGESETGVRKRRSDDSTRLSKRDVSNDKRLLGEDGLLEGLLGGGGLVGGLQGDDVLVGDLVGGLQGGDGLVGGLLGGDGLVGGILSGDLVGGLLGDDGLVGGLLGDDGLLGGSLGGDGLLGGSLGGDGLLGGSLGDDGLLGGSLGGDGLVGGLLGGDGLVENQKRKTGSWRILN